MIVLVVATKVSLTAVLFRHDASITTDMIWPNKAACDLVRTDHLLKYPSPDNADLICLQVPDHVSRKYSKKIDT